MVPLSPSRAHIDIQGTAQAHRSVLSNLLQAHALTGCDTVSNFYGIWKSTVVTVLESVVPISDLGLRDIPMREVIKQCYTFILSYKQ